MSGNNPLSLRCNAILAALPGAILATLKGTTTMLRCKTIKNDSAQFWDSKDGGSPNKSFKGEEQSVNCFQ